MLVVLVEALSELAPEPGSVSLLVGRSPEEPAASPEPPPSSPPHPSASIRLQIPRARFMPPYKHEFCTAGADRRIAPECSTWTLNTAPAARVIPQMPRACRIACLLVAASACTPGPQSSPPPAVEVEAKPSAEPPKTRRARGVPGGRRAPRNDRRRGADRRWAVRAEIVRGAARRGSGDGLDSLRELRRWSFAGGGRARRPEGRRPIQLRGQAWRESELRR